MLGSVSRHSRAIACTNGGNFQSVSVATSDDVLSSGMTVCCTEGSTVWWEGLEDVGGECAEFGGGQDTLSAFSKLLYTLFLSL